MGGVAQHDRVTKCTDHQRMAAAAASGACTAPPNPETMTRFPASPGTGASETPSPTWSGQCGHQFHRTNALLMAGDDSPCSEIDCLRARAGSLLSIVPEIAADQIKAEKT